MMKLSLELLLNPPLYVFCLSFCPAHLVYTFSRLRGLRQATLWALGKGGCVGPACGFSSMRFSSALKAGRKLKKKKHQAFFYSINENGTLLLLLSCIPPGWKKKKSWFLQGQRVWVRLRCSCRAVRSRKSSLLFFKPAGISVDWRCPNAFQECWHIFMLSLLMQTFPREPASHCSAMHQGRRKERRPVKAHQSLLCLYWKVYA